MTNYLLPNYMPDGFILIDKPSGPTSHDAINALRRLTSIRQIGHTGTLDPFATGLLIVGIGKATKELSKLVGLDKEYIATLKLGATSDTYDRTGKVSEGQSVMVSETEIKEVLKKFTGEIEQVPPMFSAKKIKGKKLYELARAGIEVERKPVKLKIYNIELHSDRPSTCLPTGRQAPGNNSILSPERSDNEVEGLPFIKIKVNCSSGTYIRSLAHDIGQALGCGAYLEELRRTSIGPFRIEEASPLASLTKENVFENIKSIESVIEKI